MKQRASIVLATAVFTGLVPLATALGGLRLVAQESHGQDSQGKTRTYLNPSHGGYL